MSAGQATVGRLAVELGISDDQLRAGLANAMVQAQQAGQRISSSLNQAGSSSGGKGFSGFAMSISRLADDAQYGFRGIVNNMEQLGMSAAQSLGASTASAMAFGGALTLTAIAINNLIPQIDNLLDARSPFEKMATSAIGFSGAINQAVANIKLLAAENEKLMQTDKTAGAGAAIQRSLTNPLAGGAFKAFATLADPFNITGFQNTKELGKTLDQQIKENRDAGRQLMRNQIDLALASPNASRLQDALQAGAGVLDFDRNRKTVETDKQVASVFTEAIKGQAENAKMRLERQMQNEGVQGNQAELDTIMLLGNAARGVKSAFEELGRRLPELQLTEKLKAAQNNKSIGEEFDRMVKDELERQSLQAKAAKMQENLDSLQLRNQRTEIIGGADAFQRNFMAATSEDPTVKAIEKQTEELSEVMKSLKELN